MEQNQTMSSVYNQAAELIKNVILHGQYEALKGENRVQLTVYYGIGRYVSQNSRNGKWGTGALTAISERLKRMLPGLRGFSAESLKKMRQFYEEWSMLEQGSALPEKEDNGNSVIAITELSEQEKEIYESMLLPATNGFPVAEFLAVPFTHHSRILNKTNELEERYYYIRRCANEHLSVDALTTLMNEDAWRTQQIPNNFSRTIDNATEARKAVMMFKDEYALDFINVEEIGERDIEDVNERVVEQQIIHNIKNFIMSFGRDFAFIGNQFNLEVCGEEHFPDLLFFNRELNSIVCVELKTGKFKSSYLGQLMTYLRILDDKIKKPHENPSIGILLCKEVNREYAEYIIQDYNKPMGVATYNTSNDMPENLRKALPDIEELRNLL